MQISEKNASNFFSRGGGYAENRRLFKGESLKNRRLMTMGGGGVKNPEKMMTSFMNAAFSKIFLEIVYSFYLISVNFKKMNFETFC